jgi:choice-of-anchor A domain-containing protein
MKSSAFLALSVLLLAPLPASASTLTDYNVVLLGNLTAPVHVEGATFVGGNLTSSQMSEFNHKGQTPPGYDGLRVGGTVTGTLKVMHGETMTYHALGAASITCDGGASNCATGGVDHSAERAQLGAQMAALSILYGGLTTTGVLQLNGNQVKLQYSGAGELAVFNVKASEIFFQNAGVELLLGNATRAVINVEGNVDVSNTNLNGAWNYDNTLWNFVDATSINLKDSAWRGTILAPKAAVANGAGIDGSLYAQSYTNSSLREIHAFSWTPETPTASVPDGGSLTTMFGGLLAGMFALRRRLR